MTFRLELEIVGLPKTTNGAHGHWRAAAAERKKWREAVMMIAKFRRPPKPLEKVRLELTRYSSSKADFDNLVISFKSCIDGLKDAGVISDDKDSVIVDRKYLWEQAPRGKGKIKIVVEQV
jgi:Holliday junction resolvase RusA-like endonuclease